MPTRAGEPVSEMEPVGAGGFWLLGAWAGAAWKQNRNRSPEPHEKKSGAGAAKQLAGSSALLEDRNKDIVLLLLIFR